MNENDDLFEFYLMSKCNYFVISNSSFSWWAATLAKSGMVYYPKDIGFTNYPSPQSNWIVI